MSALVKSRHAVTSSRCPLYPLKLTSELNQASPLSAKSGHSPLFNYFVGCREAAA